MTLWDKIGSKRCYRKSAPAGTIKTARERANIVAAECICDMKEHVRFDDIADIDPLEKRCADRIEAEILATEEAVRATVKR